MSTYSFAEGSHETLKIGSNPGLVKNFEVRLFGVELRKGNHFFLSELDR